MTATTTTLTLTIPSWMLLVLLIAMLIGNVASIVGLVMRHRADRIVARSSEQAAVSRAMTRGDL